MKKLFIFISIIIFQNLYSVEVHLKDGVVETITQKEDETLQRFSSVFADRPELFELEVGKRILPEVEQDSFKILRNFFPLIEENNTKTYNVNEKEKFNELSEDQKVALLNTADYLEIEQLSGLHEVFVEHMFDLKLVKKTFEDEHELRALKKRMERLNPCFQSYLTGQEVFLKHQENIFNDLWQCYIQKHQKELDIPEVATTLFWRPDGAIIMRISESCVKIIDDWASNGNVFQVKKCNSPEKIIWSPDGKLLLAHSTAYNDLACYDKDFNPMFEDPYFNEVSDFGWLNNEEFLIAFKDGNLSHYDIPKKLLSKKFNKKDYSNGKIALHSDGDKFVYFRRKSIDVYLVRNFEEMYCFPLQGSSFFKACTGKCAVAAYGIDGELCIFEWDKEELCLTKLDKINEIAWNSNGELLAVATQKDIQVYDTALQIKDCFNYDDQPIYTLAWGNNGRLVAGSEDKIIVWNQKQNKTQIIDDLVGSIKDKSDGSISLMSSINEIALSPDKKNLAVATKGKNGWSLKNVYILPIFDAEDTFNALDPLETLATCYFYNNYLLPSLSEAQQEIINNLPPKLLSILGAKSVENYLKIAHNSFGPLEITRSKIESILKDQGKKDIKHGKQEE